jgi:DNA-binding NarL/FixJ family response regulator
MMKQVEQCSSLTAREQEIVLLVARGLSNKAIASELNLSGGTVKVHMHNILQKLGVRTRYALVATASTPQALPRDLAT